MKELIKKIKPRLIEIFEYLHRHPEISWQEVNTTHYIANILHENNSKVTTFDDCTGVIGELGSGPITVAVRADIDALWQQVNGSFQANHSCGHDAHMTMVIGTFLLLKEIGLPQTAKCKFIFQPAEEKGTGALKMIEKKVVDDVDYLYGVHLRPAEELPDGKAAPAILHGGAQFINGEIQGQDTHGARPHLGTNAIEIGASLVHELNKIRLNPMIPYSVKMTRFVSGSESSNIIPGHAQFSLDLRAQTNSSLRDLVEKVRKVVQKISELYEIPIPLSLGGRTAAAEVDEEAQTIMSQAIQQRLGENNLAHPIMTSGGEDFHFYTLKRSHLKATMLGLGCDLKPGLHHPYMTFNREAIFSGIEILTTAVLLTFEKKKGN
ncbi:M20 peptidase aminoacylase family protein [Thermoflavimicrobium daqui]|jgi:amidohydrolase|uniref:Amidohydrolase n=1 Tax=Thermoflavimicrobium daqui TaxID=2137476 RepID=A0A364K4D1_9BACL|nr:M20 peptidase aminoacylase family protein [Thermoflavimicrobium daqui]RAL24206.1 amidohydrolase [Thermoflavimicrobium daqui]